MPKEYKVWAVIEEYDSETDTYRDIELPFAPYLGCYPTEMQAIAHTNFLEQVSRIPLNKLAECIENHQEKVNEKKSSNVHA